MLSRTVAQLSAVIDSVPTAIVMLGPAGKIELVNVQAERLFGYTRAELVGESVETLIPHRFRDKHPTLRANFAADPQARPMGAGRDLFGLRKDGTEFPIEIGLNPVKTDEGLFVLSAVVDISERTRQAAALQQSNEALERSNIDLQRFAYVASHDLQAPMRSIASFVDLLQSNYDEKLDDQGRDWLRRTGRSVKDLRVLIQDLLEYSRVDAKDRPFQRVSIREVLARATSLLDASIRESHAEVTAGDLPEVSGDPSQLVQLMLNLIGNGIKYRGNEAPRVYVSAEKRGDEWLFAVRDNGIGIAAKHHERIFEIFKRLHDASEYPGSGIGLAVCRRIVNHHGGKIWVASASGKGSVFYFTVPGGMVNHP